MNDERLSALMDDELPGDETREAVGQLLAEPEARGTWARYHLLGDALRASSELTAAATARPQADNIVPFPTRIQTKPAPARSVPRTGLGLAAAAALAAVALIVASPRPGGEAQPTAVALGTATAPPAGATSVAPTAQPVGGLAPSPSIEPLPTANISQTAMVRDDEAERRMNVYLYDFNDKRAQQSVPGMHSYVHIVGFERP